MGLKLKNLCSCRMLASAPIGECCCHLLSVLMNAAIYFLRAIGPVCIVAGMSMISTVVYTYTTFIFPEYLSYSNGFFMFNPHCIVATISALHIYGNYLLCAFTPAGSPPQTKCDSSAIFGKRVSIVDGKKIIIGNMERLDISAAVSYRYCKHCRCVKPPRARHCSISGKCILNFDHYCPWMNNAIGYNNYRYFVMFLAHTFLGSIYAFSVILPLMQQIDGHIFLIESPSKSRTIFGYEITLQFLVFMSFVVTISAVISVGMLLIWHVYLILTNQTTIEFYINMEETRDAKTRGEVFKNPFNQGYRKNLRRVFGDIPWPMAVFLSLKPPPPPDLFPFNIEDYGGYKPILVAGYNV